MKSEKLLKWFLWLGVAGIAFCPLFISGSFFFPFITTKTFFFRVAVEIMLLAYLVLAFLKKEYRLRPNWLFIFWLGYLVVIFLSSWINGQFYFSFWGNMERSEGILLILHLFALFLILAAVFQEKKEWLAIFDLSVGASFLVSLFAVGQIFHLKWVLPAQSARISSTIGNPAFLAAYLLFNFFFSLYLFTQRHNKYLKAYYLGGALLNFFIILETATRGAIVGLLAAFLAVVFFYFLFGPREQKKLKLALGGVILVFALFGLLLVHEKDAAWVKKCDFLRRMAHISLTDTTVQTRLLTWHSGWEGIKEKPILGWGYGNFYMVFNRYFSPKIYRSPHSRIWFDRAHDLLIDRAITGGILGLFFYLALIFYPLTKIILSLKRGEKQKENFIFLALLIAYFVQDLFVFDVLVSYLPLVFFLAWFSSQREKGWKFSFCQKKVVYAAAALLWAFVLLPVIYEVNVKPAEANKEVIQAMREASLRHFNTAYNDFLTALSYQTYGNQEFRLRLAEFVDTLLDKKDASPAFRRKAAEKVTSELRKQIAERPENVANYLLLMQHYNKAYPFHLSYLNDSIKLSSRALKLSPTRPHIYYELGYSQFFLARYYEGIGKKKLAEKYYQESLQSFQKSIDLNPQVIESYLNPIFVSLLFHRPQEVKKYLNLLDKRHLPYKNSRYLGMLASTAISAKDYSLAVRFYQELTKIYPQNVHYWIDLALAYAYDGKLPQAIQAAQRVEKFGGEYKKQAALFIKKISQLKATATQKAIPRH